MTSGHKMLRFMIPAVLALTVLLATGCDLLTNSDDDPAPADPNTLVLPAGTVQDWGVTPSGDWLVGYRGLEDTDDSFGRITLQNASYPGQTLTLSDFEDMLASSESRGANGAFPSAGGTTITFEPVVQMIRIMSLYGDDGDIYRRNEDYDQIVEWWYVSGDTEVSGSFGLFNLSSADAMATDLQLQAGWNTIAFTDVDGDDNWTVTTGAESAGVGWYLE